MFTMSFDQNMLENVKEHFSVWVHACMIIGLRTQLVFMHTQLGFIRMRTCSLVHTDIGSNLCMCAQCLHTQTRARVRMMLAKNPIFDYLELPFHLFLIQHKSNTLFSYFCKFRPRSQVEEALTEWQHGIGSLLLKQWPIFMQWASSQSFIYCRKDPPAPFQCNPWLRGGGTLPTPSTSLIGR